MELGLTGLQPGQTVRTPQADQRAVAKELETVFISEMLKLAGFGKAPSEFGGGIGEDQFSSFMVDQQAKAIANGKGLGLAEHNFNAMSKK